MLTSHTSLVKVRRYFIVKLVCKNSTGRWLSGRKRQAVNLLVILTLVRIRLFSIMVTNLLNNKTTFSTQSKLNVKIVQNSWKSYVLNQRLLVKTRTSSTTHNCKKSMITLNQFLSFSNYSYLQTKQYYAFFNSPGRLPVSYLLSLNFKRLRFFPGLKTTSGVDFAHLSLGLLNSFFRKGKFFLKSKISYLSLTSFFRKLLIFSGLKTFFLQINRTPKYFIEILNNLLEPVISLYKNPFNLNTLTNEQQWNPSFFFHSVIFTNPKPYGKVKVKQRGRLKRKISSRIIKLNRVLD